MPGLEAKQQYYCCTHPDAVAANTLFPRYKDKADTYGRIECIRKGNPDMRIKSTPRWCPRKIEHVPREVDKHGAYYIIDNRAPLGMFYCQEDDETYVCIDNRTGDAWVEEFETLRDCQEWLVSNEEREDIGNE